MRLSRGVRDVGQGIGDVLQPFRFVIRAMDILRGAGQIAVGQVLDRHSEPPQHRIDIEQRAALQEVGMGCFVGIDFDILIVDLKVMIQRLEKRRAL